MKKLLMGCVLVYGAIFLILLLALQMAPIRNKKAKPIDTYANKEYAEQAKQASLLYETLAQMHATLRKSQNEDRHRICPLPKHESNIALTVDATFLHQFFSDHIMVAKSDALKKWSF